MRTRLPHLDHDPGDLESFVRRATIVIDTSVLLSLYRLDDPQPLDLGRLVGVQLRRRAAPARLARPILRQSATSECAVGPPALPVRSWSPEQSELVVRHRPVVGGRGFIHRVAALGRAVPDPLSVMDGDPVPAAAFGVVEGLVRT